MNLDEYAQNFVGYTIPNVLVDLLSFANHCPSDDYFSESFELLVDIEYGLETWSSAPEFLDRLIPFAIADGNGSFYAIWSQTNQDLNNAPIIVFGGDGSFHVVAANILDFLRLIALDVEPIVDSDGVYYCRDEENYEPSPCARKYRNWLRQHYYLSPISNNLAAEQIVEQAQESYQEAFWHWIRQYIRRRYSNN